MSGDAARAFITLISVCPPASARAPSFDASSSSASATDPGFAYSTSRSSIAAILRVDAGIRLPKRPARTAGTHSEDLREDRDCGLVRRGRTEVESGRARRCAPARPRRRLPRAAARAAAPGCGASRASRRRTPRSRARRGTSGRSNLSSCVRTTTAVAASGIDVRQRLVRPEDEDLVGARHPLGRGEARRGRRRRSSASRAASPPRRAPRRCRSRRRRRVAEAGRSRRRRPSGPRARTRDCGRGAARPARAPGRGASRRRSSPATTVRTTSRLSSPEYGSTNTSISPPHGRPTPNAMSSVMPYVTSRGSPPREHLLRSQDRRRSRRSRSRRSPRGCRRRGRRASTRPAAAPSSASRRPSRRRPAAASRPSAQSSRARASYRPR